MTSRRSWLHESFAAGAVGALSWIIALIGVMLLRDEQLRALGAALGVGAGILATLGWRSWHPNDFLASSALRLAGWRSTMTAGLTGVAAALLVDAIAGWTYLAHPNETFGAAGWLWLLSVAVFLGSVFGLGRVAQPRIRSRPQVEASATRWSPWERAILGGIVLVAVVLRVWNLQKTPDNIYLDEITAGRIAASSYLHHGPGPSVFSTVWGDIDLPALWFFFLARSVQIAGETLTAVRLPSALIGAVALLPFYGLLRAIWGRSTAIAGTTIMAVTASNLHYSRLGINNILTTFCWALCFFFLVRALRSGRPLDWALAGLTAGLSEYGFYATRLLPFILLTYAAYLLVIHRQQVGEYAPGLGLVAIGYVIGFGPLLAHFMTHPRLYFHHGASILIWSQVPNSVAQFQQIWSALWRNVELTLLGISVISSQDLIYFAPLLVPVEAALLIMGVALLLRDWRHPAAFLMLLSGLGALVVGGTLLKNAPSLNRLTGAFPAFCAAVAIPIGAWIDQARERLPSSRKWIASAILAVVLVALGIWNVRFYFRDYYANPDVIIDPRYKAAQRRYQIQTALARYLGGLGPDYTVRFVVNTTVPFDRDLEKYLGGTQDYANIADPKGSLLLESQRRKGMAFIFFAGSERFRALIESRCPGGATQEVVSRGGKHLFYVYVLPPEGYTNKEG